MVKCERCKRDLVVEDFVFEGKVFCDVCFQVVSHKNCMRCTRVLANTVYVVGGLVLCPICVLGEEEGSQSKYWETSLLPNAGHPEGFRYPDDTSKYTDEWDNKKKKWIPK